MDSAMYATLSRQSGLLREMSVVANNIANLSTTGFRREGVVFAEVVRALPDGGPSLSMAAAWARMTAQDQGPIEPTGGTFDLAIDGEGFFLVETADGQRLTRAGHFLRDAEGALVTPDGARLLDDAGAPVFVPAEAGTVSVGPDGTVSGADGPLARIALVLPEDPQFLRREAGQIFAFDGDVQPAEAARLVQGFLEGSNVEPVAELARMIDVQRAYELGQRFLDREDDRIRGVLQTLGR